MEKANGFRGGEHTFFLRTDENHNGIAYYFTDKEDLYELYEKAGLEIVDLEEECFTTENGAVRNSWYHVLARKKKKAVVIGASADAIHAIELAKKRNMETYALDGNPGAKGLQAADKGIVVDIADTEAVKRVLEDIVPDCILPVPIGRHLYTTACMNECFGLKGIKKEFTKRSVDKYSFHQHMHASGLREVTAYLLEAGRVLDTKSYQVSYPVVVKPRFGAGSRDVFYCNAESELDQALQYVSQQQEDYILEEAVDGCEYGVDGAVIDGQVYVTLIRRKVLTPLPQRQATASMTVTVEETWSAAADRIRKAAGQACERMQYENCLFNMDVLVNEDEVFVIEMSPRPSGHYLHDVFVTEMTGVDMVLEYLNYLCENPYQFIPSFEKKGMIRFFDFSEKTVASVPGEREAKEAVVSCRLLKWNCKMQSSQYLEKVTDGASIMGRGYFILEGNSEEELQKDANRILELFH